MGCELKDWHIEQYGSIEIWCAFGRASGHPEFQDGRRLRTSYIREIQVCEDRLRVLTRNSLYVCRFSEMMEGGTFDFLYSPLFREDMSWLEEEIRNHL